MKNNNKTSHQRILNRQKNIFLNNSKQITLTHVQLKILSRTRERIYVQKI